MSKIASIATAVPSIRYRQTEIFEFMKNFYDLDEAEARKIKLLYDRSGIEWRYSVIGDYLVPASDRKFYPSATNLEPFPTLGKRMALYFKEAPALCLEAIHKCLDGLIHTSEITHLITVSCTGLSAPGLDIQILQELKLNAGIHRTSVNFMGCYAAVHALKQADYICKSDPAAKVLIICVELCSIHFQKEKEMENIASNLLFADGAAAVLVCSDAYEEKSMSIIDFYSQVQLDGKSDMAWNLSETGFLMTLSAYIPQLIEGGIKDLVDGALQKLAYKRSDIAHWAIHPGGRKILEVIQKELSLNDNDLESSYKILRNYGNMSSPTILFVLNDIWGKAKWQVQEKIFGAAFGPGLTMETMLLET